MPVIDFRAPSLPVKYDSTAAMISACGLLEIASHVGEHEKALYTGAVIKLLKACEQAFADWEHYARWRHGQRNRFVSWGLMIRKFP
jgi:unsaturated chondroitin disaccharide hydrolase